MNEHEMLNDLLEELGKCDIPPAGPCENLPQVYAAPPSQPQQVFSLDYCQWAAGSNQSYRPTSRTVGVVPSGAYLMGEDQLGPYLKRQDVLCDELVELPDSANARVLAAMKKFWASGERYRKHGLLHKRGILLWGPPGSGKTATVSLLSGQLVANDGLVLLCNNPHLLAQLMRPIRQIEPNRPIIVVMEDVDEIIAGFGEKVVLSILDGEAQVDNVVYLATTNHPEQLGARIVNRPSRFDERIYVGMPSEAARLSYLDRVAGSRFGVAPDCIAEWVRLTDGLSIAHLRELVAAVLCLDQELGDVIERLKAMGKRPRTNEDGFAGRELGFKANGGIQKQWAQAGR